MIAHIALVFFQVVFSDTRVSGLNLQPAYVEAELAADCSTTTAAAWAAGDIVWPSGPFDTTAANSDVGSGCAGSAPASVGDISF